jgi:hypothetical protein
LTALRYQTGRDRRDVGFGRDDESHVVDDANHLGFGTGADPARTQRHKFAERLGPEILARERATH